MGGLNSTLAGLCCPPGRSGWWCGAGPRLTCIPPWVQELPGRPFAGSGEVFTFSGLCSSCALLPNIFEHLIFCIVLLWHFPGAPREAIFHWYLVGMESNTPPLINSLLMSQSHGCFALPCVPSASLSHHLPAALTVAAFEQISQGKAGSPSSKGTGGVFFSSFQTKNTPCIIQKTNIKHIKLVEEKYIPLSMKRECLQARTNLPTAQGLHFPR